MWLAFSTIKEKGGLSVSSKGIFTALSGAMAQTQRLDTIANNIANANTTSFKKDEQTFREYLTAYEKPPDVIQVPRVPASIESFYNMQGGDRALVESSGVFTDFSQGIVKPTGNTLDLAIEGQGFFEVLTPQGVRLTRNGALNISAEGLLVTRDGHPVLREGLGQDPNGRMIQVSSRNVTFSQSGEIYEGGESLGRLSLVRPENLEALQKVGSSSYRLRENFQAQLIPADTAQVQQGFLEGSNVNIIKEMTDMIGASRAFESAQQTMKAFDQMDAKLVNELARR